MHERDRDAPSRRRASASASASRSSALPPWTPTNTACLPGGARGAIVGEVAHQRDLVGAPREDGLERSRFWRTRARDRGALRSGLVVIDQSAPLTRALAHARQVDLAVVARAAEAAAVAAAQVVAEDARPDERVDVQIDHVAGEVELDGLARDPQRVRPRRARVRLRRPWLGRSPSIGAAIVQARAHRDKLLDGEAIAGRVRLLVGKRAPPITSACPSLTVGKGPEHVDRCPAERGLIAPAHAADCSRRTLDRDAGVQQRAASRARHRRAGSRLRGDEHRPRQARPAAHDEREHAGDAHLGGRPALDARRPAVGRGPADAERHLRAHRQRARTR